MRLHVLLNCYIDVNFKDNHKVYDIMSIVSFKDIITKIYCKPRNKNENEYNEHLVE